MEDWVFVLALTVLIFFLVQIGAMAGPSLVKNAPPPPAFPQAPEAPSAWDVIAFIISMLGFIFGNVVYFFQLMTVSTEYALFGGLVLLPLLITLFYIIIRLIIDAIGAIIP